MSSHPTFEISGSYIDLTHEFKNVIIKSGMNVLESDKQYTIDDIQQLGVNIDNSWSCYGTFPYERPNTILLRRSLQVAINL